MSAILVVAGDGALEAQISRVLLDVDGDAEVTLVSDLANVHGRLRTGEVAADVVVLGPRLEVGDALVAAEMIERIRPDACVVLVTEPSAEVWELAMVAGVRDLVPVGADDRRLVDALTRAMESASRRQPVVVDLREGAAADREQTARVITVLSPKGGAGKTTVATNLAVGLAAGCDGGVALIDLDLQFGDVGTALALDPEYSVADLAGTASSLEGTALKAMFSHHRSGLWALCSPSSPAAAEAITSDDVTRAITLLLGELRYVVIDTGAGLDEATLAAIDISTDLVLVSGLDVPSVKALRKEIEALDLLGMVAQHRHFLLNRADSRVGLVLADVERTIGHAIDVSVPSSRSVPLSINQGSPVLESDARSAVARPLQELVSRFLPVSVPSGGRGSRWPWIGGGS